MTQKLCHINISMQVENAQLVEFPKQIAKNNTWAQLYLVLSWLHRI